MGRYWDRRLIQPRIHLTARPILRALDPAGSVTREYEYRKDFAEVARFAQSRGEARGNVMGVAYGPEREAESNAQFGLGNSAAMDHIIIVREADFAKVVTTNVKAVLIIADDSSELKRRDVYPYELARPENPLP